MIEEKAVVVREKGGLIEVEAFRQASCGGCNARGGCASGTLAGLFGRRRHRIWVHNSIGATPGDAVILGMRDETFLAVSVFAYLVPLAGFMAGGAAGDALSRTLDHSTEIGAIMGAVAVMAAGLGIFRRTTNGAAQARQQIVLLRKEPTGIGTVSLC